MISCHVLVHNSKKTGTLEKCLSTLDGLDVDLVDSESTHVGELRYQAFLRARHDWVTFVDDDDYITPGRFQDMLNARREESDVVYSDMVSFNATSHSRLSFPQRVTFKTLLCSPFSVLHPKLMRRETVLRAMDVMLRYPTYEEAALLLRMAKLRAGFEKVDGTGYFKSWHTYGAGSRITAHYKQSLVQEALRW